MTMNVSTLRDSIQTATCLEELADALDATMTYCVSFGLDLEDLVNPDEIPKFGDPPRHNTGAYSWDDEELLIYNTSHMWELFPRTGAA